MRQYSKRHLSHSNVSVLDLYPSLQNVPGRNGQLVAEFALLNGRFRQLASLTKGI